MTYGSVIHDPAGRWDSDLPLDRELSERLATVVLGWRRDDGTVPPQGAEHGRHADGHGRGAHRPAHEALVSLNRVILNFSAGAPEVTGEWAMQETARTTFRRWIGL
ncbi:hypothetical protein [Streptomyces lunalinharesii]|uniref:Uncharacterized protein n=1 Tax=Streptomyces lunalinharesii TaxID=333384 RepID=A0ABN3T4X3_9ACTN